MSEDMQTGWNYGDLAERVVFGEEAADGLAVDLAGGEVDETLVVLGAVLDLRSGESCVILWIAEGRVGISENEEVTTGRASMKLL